MFQHLASLPLSLSSVFFLRYGMLEKSRFCDEFVGGRSYLDEKASVCAGIKGVYRVPPNGAHSHSTTLLRSLPASAHSLTQH